MKTLSENIDVEVSGEEESASLQIDANAKAFKELISGIYSDKVYAICRELSANAWDSHKMKGNLERPFELHLPTVFEPHFSIRDFGVSMTYAIVMDLYRHLFKSSKDDENDENANDFVGKFGLGSKTPFAYTDSFMLTTYLDGVVRQYDIYFGKKGPVLSMMLEDETEEEDGVMVSFPVKEKDMDDFARAAARALEPYAVLPVMTGRKVSPPVREIKAQGNGWKLLDNTETGAMEALQGTVLYPLSFESIPDCPARFKPLIQSPFHIEFPIGDLDVVTSRERLSFDERTTKNIIDRLHQVADDITKSVADARDNSTTYHSWCNAYYTMKASYNSLIWAVIEQNPPKFKGRWTPTETIKANIKDALIAKMVPGLRDPSVLVKITQPAPRFGSLEVMVLASGYGMDSKMGTTGLVTKLNYTNLVCIPTARKVIVVRHDTTKRVTYVSSRLNEIYKANRNHGTIILYIRHDGEADRAALKRLWVYLGRPEFTEHNIHDIAPVISEKRRYAKDAFKIWKYNDWSTPDDKLIAELAEGTFTGDVWYIDTERGVPTHPRWASMPFSIVQVRSMLVNDCGFDETKDILIGIPKNMRLKHTEYVDLYQDAIAAAVASQAKKYDRSISALSGVKFSAISGNGVTSTNSPGYVSPFIYDSLDVLETIWNEYRIKHKKNGIHTKPTFNEAVVGTVLEDVVFWKNMVSEASDYDNYQRAYCGYSHKAVEAENKLLAKERGKYIHTMNVAGGKAIRAIPLCWAIEGTSYLSFYVKKKVGAALIKLLTA